MGAMSEIKHRRDFYKLCLSQGISLSQANLFMVMGCRIKVEKAYIIEGVLRDTEVYRYITLSVGTIL